MAEKKSGGATCLKIGGIGCVLVLVAGTIGIYLVVVNAKNIALSGARAVAVAGINDSGMAADQKKEFIRHIDRVIDGAKSGKVSNEQLGKIMEKLASSPLIPMAMVAAADKKYVQGSGLSAEEKKRGLLDLQRLGRGVAEKDSKGQGKISGQDVEEVMALITTTDARGQKKVKETLTDQEVRAFLAKVREKADGASIPEEPYQINFGDEFGKVVDEVLEEGESAPGKAKQSTGGEEAAATQPNAK